MQTPLETAGSVPEEPEQQGNQYRSLAEAIPQIVWTARADGCVEYLNRRWLNYTGRSETSSHGWGWTDVVHPDDMSHCLRLWKTSLETGQPYELQYRLRRHDGVYRWFLGRAIAVYNRDFRIVKWFGTCTDIDDQKNSERQHQILADAGAVLSASLDYEPSLQAVAQLVVPDFADWCVIEMVGEDGKIRPIAHADASKSPLIPERQVSYQQLSDAGNGARQVIHTGKPELAPVISDSFLRSITCNEAHFQLLRGMNLKSYICAPIGARGRIFGAITFSSSQDGRRYGVQDLRLAEELARRAAVTVDNARLYQEGQREIAERKRIQDELAEADRRKDEFVATLAHELRNPMAPIRQAMHVIRMFATADPTVKRAREIVERQVTHMVRLVDDLLDVSRMQRGLITLRKERLNLNTAIKHAVESASALLGARKHRVEVLPSTERIMIEGDATRIEQTLVNLLSNAAKYTPQGGHIRVSAGRENGRAVIRVKDTGIGIAPDLVPRIFDLFTQANHSLDRSDGGLGIGLTLVRHLVELHGGTVTAHSEGLGRGSEFIVSLPPVGSEVVPAKPPSVRREPAAGSGETKSVLVVEDNDDSRETLQTILEMWGHKVTVARDGREGLQTALRERHQLALIDVGLPEMNGYDLARSIRNKVGRSMFLVALTGYGQPEDRKRAFEAGFDAHLVKPADLEELGRIIETAPGIQVKA
jgi:PAS domain S-box-containing protein